MVTMRTLPGIAASPGVAIGEALIIGYDGYRIPRRLVTRDAVDDELYRLNNAIDAVAAEIALNRDTIHSQLGAHYSGIFAAQLQMLRDPQLYSELELAVRERSYSPEFAVTKTFRRYAKIFQQLGRSALAERAHDFFDLERGLLRKLLGEKHEELSHLSSPVVVLAHNLTPSETAGLDRKMVLGFATEVGGASGHSAIVARGLEIPAVVALGDFLMDLAGGEIVIVDGDLGRVILQPDETTLEHYRNEIEHHRDVQKRLTGLRDLPAQTTDGVSISLSANIEFPREVDSCVTHGADGIGLFRTEFLFLESATEPTEDEQYEAYASVVTAMKGRPVTIRTLDLGADKLTANWPYDAERNPFLGLRSIRLSLRQLSAFRSQLRAILRASAFGPVRVMFPLISTIQELGQAKSVLLDAMDDLDDAKIPFDRSLDVGMMVEVPSAVIMLDKFMPAVRFVSVGTNDLIQYALAVDRSNNEVADRYQAGDPCILRLLDMIIRTSRTANVAVNICGQMSSQPLYTMLLIGLGMRSLSVPPATIPEIKNVCRRVAVSQCEEVARRALTMDSPREIDSFLRDELRKIVPDSVHD